MYVYAVHVRCCNFTTFNWILPTKQPSTKISSYVRSIQNHLEQIKHDFFSHFGLKMESIITMINFCSNSNLLRDEKTLPLDRMQLYIKMQQHERGTVNA